MQALIDFLIRNLLALWPIARVYSWQQGLRVRKGIAREELAPGLHWRWWFIDEVKVWPTTEQARDLQAAAVTTHDGLSVTVSANIGYRMTSIRTMWLTIWDADNTIAKLVVGQIAASCATREWAQLRAMRPDLQTELTARLNEIAAGWGVHVVRVAITDLVIAKPHRHYLDGMHWKP